jgi:hypothetical protein
MSSGTGGSVALVTSTGDPVVALCGSASQPPERTVDPPGTRPNLLIRDAATRNFMTRSTGSHTRSSRIPCDAPSETGSSHVISIPVGSRPPRCKESQRHAPAGASRGHRMATGRAGGLATRPDTRWFGRPDTRGLLEPTGIRVSDAVAWAHRILDRYEGHCGTSNNAHGLP